MVYKETVVDELFIQAMEQYRQPNKELGLIGACQENVIVFAERMLGIRPYAWQVSYLHDIQQAVENPESQREYVAITSRQIGKSTAIAIFSLWVSVFNKYPGTTSNNTSVLISSASDVQAKKLLYEMKKLLRLGDRHMEHTYKDEEDKPLFGKDFFSKLLDDNEPNNTTTITFSPYNADKHGEYLLLNSKSGSTIKSYPPTSGVLGETASVVIVDEAGKTDKISDQFFFDYLYPTGNSTNAVRLYTSTPWVPSGFFYRMVDPDDIYGSTPAKVCMFSVDAIKLENPDYHKVVMKTVNQMNKDGKNDEVQRAYYCRFVKGEQSYFDPENVLNCFTKDYKMQNSWDKKCDMGVDFGGQVVSKTVITITELTDDGNIRRLYHQVYPVGEDRNLIDDIAQLKKQFNIERIIPDDCPAGQYLIREMQDKGWNVEPMSFRADKVKKYGAFRSMLRKGKVQSYEDEELKTEMLAMEFTNSSRQSVISHAPGYSDDRIDSFVMSAYFYVQEEGGFKVFSLGNE